MIWEREKECERENPRQALRCTDVHGAVREQWRHLSRRPDQPQLPCRSPRWQMSQPDHPHVQNVNSLSHLQRCFPLPVQFSNPSLRKSVKIYKRWDIAFSELMGKLSVVCLCHDKTSQKSLLKTLGLGWDLSQLRVNISIKCRAMFYETLLKGK